jgi:hypothetical protein
LYQILIIIDDFSDSPEFTRKSKLLHQLYIRGRHNCISTTTSTQKYYAIAPIVKINQTNLIIFRLRNYKDLESIVEELSALAPKSTLLQMYNEAVKDPYSFLFINLSAHDKNHMFYMVLRTRLSKTKRFTWFCEQCIQKQCVLHVFRMAAHGLCALSAW